MGDTEVRHELDGRGHDLGLGLRADLPLYASYYGLTESPFDLTPNPRFLYLSARQREALSNLRYALASSKGFTLILGEAGTGKTTLVRTVLGSISDSSRYVLVNNPTLNRQEFYEFLTASFGLSPAAAISKTRFLAELRTDVEARFAAGGLTGLIVDEAQSLPHELLEEIRLLGNLETATTKLLNIVLCGQPELADRLNETSLRQLKQRVALRCELGPLSLAETASYISGRLRIAGGTPSEVFTRDAVLAIYDASQGIPRTINVVCDNALIGGLAAQVKPVSADIVEAVGRDFDLPSGQPRALGDDQPSSGQAMVTTDRTSSPAPAAPTSMERAIFGSVQPPTKRNFSFFLDAHDQVPSRCGVHQRARRGQRSFAVSGRTTTSTC